MTSVLRGREARVWNNQALMMEHQWIRHFCRNGVVMASDAENGAQTPRRHLGKTLPPGAESTWRTRDLESSTSLKRMELFCLESSILLWNITNGDLILFTFQAFVLLILPLFTLQFWHRKSLDGWIGSQPPNSYVEGPRTTERDCF